MDRGRVALSMTPILLSIAFSLLCGPISPVVNLEMPSTASFFFVEMQYIGAQD